MLEGFSAPRVAYFYDNESSGFQHTEMSEAVSGQSEIHFIAVLCFVNWSSHMVCMVTWNCYTIQLSIPTALFRLWDDRIDGVNPFLGRAAILHSKGAL